MKIEGLVKKSSVAKEYTKLDIARMDYTEETAQYYEDEKVDTITGAELTDIFESEKTNKKGEKYISRFARFTVFDDDAEEKIGFPITFWNEPKDGIVRIKPNNPLANLIKFVMADEVNNQFDVDYEMLQKIISDIISMDITIRVIEVRNGFETYGFDVKDIQFKGE